MNRELAAGCLPTTPTPTPWPARVALALLLVSPVVAASSKPSLLPCFEQAAEHYGLASELLWAIAQTESRLDPLAVNTTNRDGSWDIGLMQINSRWLPQLRQAGIAPESLYDPCTSIWVGAWVLAGNVAHYGYGWQAVGAYNAGTADSHAASVRRERYADRVHRQLRRAGGLRADTHAP